jgi:hypothetical protein
MTQQHSVIFSDLDPDLRRARKTLRFLTVLAAGAAITAVVLVSSSPVFAASDSAAAKCREYFKAGSYDKAAMHCAARMEPKQIEKAEAKARDWKDSHGDRTTASSN